MVLEIYLNAIGLGPGIYGLVVHATGGLADTIVDADAPGDAGTGFLFSTERPSQIPEALTRAIRRAVDHRRNREAWTRLVRRAMRQDLSWTRVARRHDDLYATLVGDRRPIHQPGLARRSTPRSCRRVA